MTREFPRTVFDVDYDALPDWIEWSDQRDPKVKVIVAQNYPIIFGTFEYPKGETLSIYIGSKHDVAKWIGLVGELEDDPEDLIVYFDHPEATGFHEFDYESRVVHLWNRTLNNRRKYLKTLLLNSQKGTAKY